MTRSELFKAAHTMAKTFVGNYSACFSLALKTINKQQKASKMRTAAAILAEINKINAADRKYNDLMNEGGEGYQREKNVDALYAEYVAAEEAEFKALWTKDYTTQARAAWNTAVTACKSNKAIKTQAQLIAAVEKMSGHKMADVQRAKAIHG